MIVALLQNLAVARGREGAFFSIHWCAMVVLCSTLHECGHTRKLVHWRPLLLFLVLLTLL